ENHVLGRAHPTAAELLAAPPSIPRAIQDGRNDALYRVGKSRGEERAGDGGNNALSVPGSAVSSHSTVSTTPAPPAPRVTTSARTLSAGTALATATPRPQMARTHPA